MKQQEQYLDRHYLEEMPAPKKKHYFRNFFILLLLAGIGYGVFYWFSLEQPPATFPVQQELRIEEGTGLRGITKQLAEENYIQSELYFTFSTKSKFGNDPILAGRYVFEDPLTVTELLDALTTGKFLAPPVTATFPEGLRGETMAPLIEEYFPHLAPVNSRVLDEHLGYLFPDTYFVPDDITLATLITLMRNNFNTKTNNIDFSDNPSGLTKEEIIILASIIEREANDEQSMKLVSGVLHNRLDIRMALQVDATFEFLLNKTSAELTQDDLDINSPYNTYNNLGLPPTPIANPGLMAIQAAIYPDFSGYLYYLTGNDGNFYYAESFDEHKRNKERYLR